MTQPKRKIVSELSKLYENILSKGKDHQRHVTETILRNRESFPEIPTTQQLANRMRDRVNQSMTAYEDFIGIRQVKEAHERVLQAELNFKSCQEERRTAQSALADVQDQLRVLRVDIDRTPRGDNRYLELIKSEIDIIREERQLRTSFEELERLEREVFSELSNALRFSHEKERAQSEKTKYWSILGSLIGACIGIVGTTLNSRLRHQQTKAILAQTSAQVQQIEETVMQLASKLEMDKEFREASASINSNLMSMDSSKLDETIDKLLKATEEHERILSKKTGELITATSGIERKLGKMFVRLMQYEDPALNSSIQPTKFVPLDQFANQENRSWEKEVVWAGLGIIIISTIIYKLI